MVEEILKSIWEWCRKFKKVYENGLESLKKYMRMV